MNARHRSAGCVAAVALSIALAAGFAPAAVAEPAGASAERSGVSSPVATLTNIIGIMGLSRDEAARELPVEVEGVVTCTYSHDVAFFIYDGQAGVYVDNPQPPRHFGFRERVRVKGKSLHGAFCPMIQGVAVESLGPGTLPPPPPVSFARLASGAADSQWLEIHGVVQATTPFPSQQGVTFDLAMEGGTLQVLVESPQPPDLNWLVDAQVRIQGVASGSFNKKGQMVAPVFRVANLSLVQVEQPAQTNWAELPLKRISQLLVFSPRASLSRRVRVRGVVTGCQPGQSVYLRDRSDALKVETTQPVDYQPGEVVEAAGFPAMSPYSAELRHAVCSVVGKEAAPQPAEASLESVLGGLHDAELIRLRARLVDWVVDDNGITLALQSERSLFKGYLGSKQAPASWSMEKNSLIEVTGICDIRELEKEVWYYQPRSFMLLLRSAQDLTVLQRPPWLNAARLWRLISVLSLLLASAGVWVWALRKEVGRKRELIEHQAKRVAVMEERTRIARDLHDTLEQGLTGLSLQLKVVEATTSNLPSNALPELQLARRMLSNTRALTHFAVQELRDSVPASEPLLSGLDRTAQFWNRTGALTVALRLAENMPSLTRTVEEPLLAIAREAITNAVRHGQATAIEVELGSTDGTIQLRVRDNGSGFDPHTLRTEGGHFGLQGMRERLESVGGRLEIRSRPGRGTELEVIVPLKQLAPSPVAAGNQGSDERAQPPSPPQSPISSSA